MCVGKGRRGSKGIQLIIRLTQVRQRECGWTRVPFRPQLVLAINGGQIQKNEFQKCNASASEQLLQKERGDIRGRTQAYVRGVRGDLLLCASYKSKLCQNRVAFCYLAQRSSLSPSKINIPHATNATASLYFFLFTGSKKKKRKIQMQLSQAFRKADVLDMFCSPHMAAWKQWKESEQLVQFCLG